MDKHLNIWMIVLLSLPSQDIILGPGMQLYIHVALHLPSLNVLHLNKLIFMVKPLYHMYYT